MKKILFIFASVLMFTACGSGDIAGDVKAIIDDATKSINEAKSQAEIDLIMQECDNELFALYEANTEECDLLKERLARYLSDKDNMKLPEEEKTALAQLAAAKVAYDKAVEAKEKEFDPTNEKNVDAKAYSDFVINCLN